MKCINFFFLFFVSTNLAFALSLEELALNKDLSIQSSRGPKYRQQLQDHALNEWGNVVDLNNLIDDGLIHSVYEGLCDPQDVYDVDEVSVEMDDWPSMYVSFDSIKDGSKSIAYVAHPVVVYEATYEVYKTHADYKKQERSTLKLECHVASEIGFYYEHNSESEVIYLGHAYDLSEVVPVEVAPDYGVLINGRSVKDESVALTLFNEFKNAEDSGEDVDVCYFGDWESAVESVHSSVVIGVVDIYSSGELEVEIFSKESDTYTYGLIRLCN
jgi:hypothetical protein